MPKWMENIRKFKSWAQWVKLCRQVFFTATFDNVQKKIKVADMGQGV